MLKESGLYSFIDEKHGFVLHFFEGQQLIKTLAVIHPLGAKGFSALRDTVLMFQPMISLLKPHEGFGFYIDSSQPQFMLKIETNVTGKTRILLLPENFDNFPNQITGIARLIKIFGDTKEKQYSSSIELKGVSLPGIANKILEESYQVAAKCFISEVSDQSLMILALPKSKLNLDEYFEKIKDPIQQIFNRYPNEKSEIIEAMEKIGLTFLTQKEVKFFCNCSRERMISGIKAMAGVSPESIFGKNKSIEIKCDYCKTAYLITRKEIS